MDSNTRPDSGRPKQNINLCFKDNFLPDVRKYVPPNEAKE